VDHGIGQGRITAVKRVGFSIHQRRSVPLKKCQKALAAGALPGPRCGSLRRSPGPISRLRGEYLFSILHRPRQLRHLVLGAFGAVAPRFHLIFFCLPPCESQYILGATVCLSLSPAFCCSWHDLSRIMIVFITLSSFPVCTTAEMRSATGTASREVG